MRTLLAIASLLVFMTIGHAAEGPTKSLRFFVVSDKPIPNGHYLDTSDFPKVGYISNTPSLVVARLQSVTVVTNTTSVFEDAGGKEVKTVLPSVVIQMLPADGKRFGKLTRENVGRRVVLMLGDRPLTAPVIISPIDSGSVQVSGGRKSMQSLADTLKQLVQ
jgi:preprotein translocase subunit SecD